MATTRLVAFTSPKSKDGVVVDEKSSGISDSVHSVDEKVPPLGAPVDSSNSGGFNALFSYWKRKVDPDAIATQPSVFDNPATLEKYRPPPQFENTHRFDPLARWTWREEHVRHTSITILPFLIRSFIGYSTQGRPSYYDLGLCDVPRTRPGSQQHLPGEL